MNNNNNNMVKKMVKKAIIAVAKPLIVGVLIVTMVTVLITGILDIINVTDGTVQDEDWSNAPYAAEKYSDNITIDDKGKIYASMTAKETWDKLIENKSRIEKYLDKPEELKRILNAELITNFLDTRPDPDLPIDWNSINSDASSKEIQGIIKLKRAMLDGSKITMTYVDPATFESYINAYNNAEQSPEGDAARAKAMEDALKHFTLEKTYQSTGGEFYVIGTDGTAKKIENGTEIVVPQDDDYGTTYTYNSWQLIGAGKQLELKKQAGVTFDEEGFGRINGRYTVAVTPIFGNVGDYIDYYYIDENGVEQMIPCIICDVKGSDAQNKWGHHGGKNILEFYVNEETWIVPGWDPLKIGYKGCGKASSMHVNPGESGFHEEWRGHATKIINGGSYFDNPNFVEGKIKENEGNTVEVGKNNGGSNASGNSNTDASSKGKMCWPTDGTTISSGFGLRNRPTEGASTDHKGIDIGVPEGTNVYAADDGTVAVAGYDNAAGYYVVINHDNGYVTKYMHNSELKVSAGQTVRKGEVIALSGRTGVATGPHLHFQVELNGEPIDPLSFEYENGMGGISSSDGRYYAKIATWRTVEEQLEANDPDVEEYHTYEYRMIPINVDYQSLVEPYTMPFEYLWDLLLVGQEKEFILELADLVYDSQMEITVHDNLTVDTTVDTDTYTKHTKVTTRDVSVSWSATKYNYDEETGELISSNTTSGVSQGGPFTEERSNNYKSVQTEIITTNTLDICVTKADVWIVDYEKEYTQAVPEVKETVKDTKIDDTSYPDSPDKTDHEDAFGLAEAFRKRVENAHSGENTSVSASVTSLTSDYYYKTTNRNINSKNTINTTKYIASPAVIKEKTDPYASEPNFATIYIKKEHATNANNIHSAVGWLCDILKRNESTKDMVDVTKYLMYKIYNRTYGVTNFDFSIYDTGSFTAVGNEHGGNSNIGGIQGQIYDFFLAKGIPPVGVAAILGNIEEDSNFNPEESGSTGSGLCKWNDSKLAELRLIAKELGTDWTDVKTQCEYLWSELANNYKDVTSKIMSAAKEENLEYATWYFGRYYDKFFLGDNFNSTKSKTATRYENAKKWYQEWESKHSN